jgi:hypothetical protein
MRFAPYKWESDGFLEMDRDSRKIEEGGEVGVIAKANYFSSSPMKL